MKPLKYLIVFICIIISNAALSQIAADSIYLPSIKTIKLFQQNNQASLPIIRLNSSDKLEIHFDDLDSSVKNYSYTYQLCNADWQPADISAFDYIKGFQQQQFTVYRVSSVAETKYVHYMALLPEQNCVPSASGNYLLKVFLNNDPDQIAFTKKMYVVDSKAPVTAQILTTFDNSLFHTHQKIQFNIATQNLNLYSPAQQVKVTILQNDRWDNAVTNLQPTFIRPNSLEYSGEDDNLIFAGGREYRWIDLRSFRYNSDRVAYIDKNKKPVEIIALPDFSRKTFAYFPMSDLNGFYEISNADMVNPWWQGDYALVHFTYVPENKAPFDGKDLYMIGELTGNNLTGDAKMIFNEDKGVYEKTLLLKQGYYNYLYVTKDNTNPDAKPDASLTEGNFWEAENNYTIFVYYRAMGGRYDELVSATGISSVNTNSTN
jgi:hypothetical protein